MTYVLRAIITGQEVEQDIVSGIIPVIETDICHWPNDFVPNADITYTGYPRVELTEEMTEEKALIELKEIILNTYPEWKGDLSAYPLSKTCKTSLGV